MPDLPYDPPEEVDLRPGDWLVMMTDGFYEWEGPGGDRFGSERLVRVLRAAGESAPASLHTSRRSPPARLRRQRPAAG